MLEYQKIFPVMEIKSWLKANLVRSIALQFDASVPLLSGFQLGGEQY